MLRIHFTADDLARVRVAREPDPLWETVLGAQQLLMGSRGPAVFRGWRQRARQVLVERRLTGPARLLGTIAPNSAYFPDFLTPAEAAGGLRPGLDAVRATARGRLARDVKELACSRAVERTVLPWLRDLARGDEERMADLTAALRVVHDTVIGPDWTGTAAAVEGARALHTRALRDGGVHGLLGALGPGIRWEPPVLYADYPVEKDVRLAGRGLRLVPSAFCWRTPVTLADEALAPVLVHPVERCGTATAAPQPLAALLGRTRAAVLAALRDASTTGELARRLGVSPSCASQHVHALVAAHLVISCRTGNQVLHVLTRLGEALLLGGGLN
ncbi:winged helix-turn-helix domain-containing protein [Streptomyces sp. VMFN-G11Ma]|uniref:winged helix-turn-helix domain-containing protein n=1 Tax=Streptomyces sp. VMFN-G11Ma TaxID=2135609 RepID=UPI000D361829|nr:winged helix-turn-helix domain-containing protein [Streptomyces sp. VMFN-G11Ma]PTM91266.1 ArsR family transcriptional regulator [Streptomyces sp. VMFN-G11Ma]